MKYLLNRLTALTLAILVLISAVPLVGATDRPDPFCTLGTFSGDMLAGGSRVQTEDGLFYVGDDGYVYQSNRGRTPVYAKQAACLNYVDGVLYMARLHDGGFDLVGYDVASGTETVYLDNFSGELRQLYVVDGSRMVFLVDHSVMELSLETRAFRMIRFAENLWSFVPTGCGLIWASGTLFDYRLHADNYLIAEHVDGYYVDFETNDGVLVYTQGGVNYQIDLGYAFVGEAQPSAYTGVSLVNVSAGDETLDEDEILAREAKGAEHAHDGLEDVDAAAINQPAPLAPAVNNTVPEQTDIDPEDYLVDPQAPTEPEPTEPEPTEPEPAEPEPTEPAPAPTEPEPVTPAKPAPTEPAPAPTEPAPAPTEPAPAPTEPAPAPTEPAPVEPTLPAPAEPTAPAPAEPSVKPEPEQPSAPASGVNVPVQIVLPTAEETDGMEEYPRRAVSTDVENTVRRARQMTSIRWTPRQDIRSWGGYCTYRAGVTYTGLPYCQAVSGFGGHYVPWAASLEEFIGAVNDVNSEMYTSRCTYYRGGPSFGVDCSAFVSWALDLPQRCTTAGIYAYGTQKQSSVSLIQVGDFLNVNGSDIQHVVLVTDVAYDTDGSIFGVEISEATAWTGDPHMCCCRSTWFTGNEGLARLQQKYFGSGYRLYSRNYNRPVSYEHTCVASIPGDECAVCGAGMLLRPGVDVSQWQGVIDWQTLAPYIDFAIIRIGYRALDGTLNYDPQYENNVQGCEANGIPYGVYFYSIAHNELEAMEEADFVLAKIWQTGKYPSLPVFLDVEDRGVLTTLSNDQLLATISTFCDYLGQFNLRTGVYASESPWNGQFTDGYYKSRVSWVAKWADANGTVSPDTVQTLNARSGANLWQYGAGRMPGVNTLVDLDYWLGEVGTYEHRYVSVLSPSSCTETGSLSYQCVDCGLSIVKELKPLGHDFVDGACVRCGSTMELYDAYADLSWDAWYASCVSFVLERGLFIGTSKTKFSPNASMTRAMLVTVLWRMAGQPEMEAVPPFSDVSEADYYAVPVTWAARYGIISGTGHGAFSPSDRITREQAVAVLYRYAQYIARKDVSASADYSGFRDASLVSSYASEPMSWAVAVGIIQGSGGAICPQDGATRAELSKMLKCCIEWMETAPAAEN